MVRFRTSAVAVLLCLAVLPVRAATFCVSTGTQLYNSLVTAANNGQNDLINIQQGVMTGTGAPAASARWEYRAQPNDNATALTISGGWNAGCASQVVNPLATQLDAQNAATAIEITNGSGDPLSGAFIVRNLTITRGRALVATDGAGVLWRVDGTATNSLLLENVFVAASTSAASNTAPVMVTQSGSGSVKIRNANINNNVMASGGGSGGLSVTIGGTAVGFLSNNSIYSNTAGDAAAGLYLFGVITASNNAVAGNTSTAGTSYQAYAAVGTGLTLRNNHFATRLFTGGASSEMGTTTGDPQWDIVGSIATPKTISVLRDSGTNSPTGGLAATDFSGNARIVNVTVDRGAIEAAAVPNIGPTLSALLPTPGTATFLPNGLTGTTATANITFAATGGTGVGVTNLVCVDDNPNVTLSASANQTIAVGGLVTPVTLTLTYAQLSYNAGVVCTATTSGNPSYSFTYAFIMPNGSAQGPNVLPMAPAAGGTTALSGLALDELVSSTITFTAQGGANGGVSNLQCAPLAGAIAVTDNASQTIASGAVVLPVGISMVVTGTPQVASVRCTITRLGSAAVNYDYGYTLIAPVAILVSGFED